MFGNWIGEREGPTRSLAECGVTSAKMLSLLTSKRGDLWTCSLPAANIKTTILFPASFPTPLCLKNPESYLNRSRTLSQGTEPITTMSVPLWTFKCQAAAFVECKVLFQPRPGPPLFSNFHSCSAERSRITWGVVLPGMGQEWGRSGAHNRTSHSLRVT